MVGASTATAAGPRRSSPAGGATVSTSGAGISSSPQTNNIDRPTKHSIPLPQGDFVD